MSLSETLLVPPPEAAHGPLGLARPLTKRRVGLMPPPQRGIT